MDSTGKIARHYDVVVAGGGMAGSAAAIAAARGGASVLLVEASGALGGSATNCLVNPFMSWKATIEENGKKRQLPLSRGLFAEIHGALNEDGLYGEAREWSIFNEETLKLVLDRKAAAAGVDVLFHATLCGATAADRKVKSVSVATVGGMLRFEAESFVDATGDATLSALAGVPFRKGRERDSLCQPMTRCFRMCNVDVEAALRGDPEIRAAYKAAVAEGRISCPNDSVQFFPMRVPGVLHFNMTRVVKHDPTDAFAVSDAERVAREQVLEIVRFMKGNFAPFKNASLMMTAASIGVRESRRIEARHLLTETELMAGTHFPDAIAAGNYQIDIHSPDGTGAEIRELPPGAWYTIPYRSLLPESLDNLVVAGRCIGATHAAQAAIRIMPTCICMGEAAGTAVALAKELGTVPAVLDADALRNRLRENGAFV